MARALKRLERAGKRLVFRLLKSILPERRAVVPDWNVRSYRVLFLRYDRIGDMILSSGLFSALVAAHPTFTIDVLASPANAAVIAGNPRVNDCIVLDRRHLLSLPRTLLELRRRRYDVVIDPMIWKASLNATLLMYVSGARWRVGVGDRTNAFAYTLPVPQPDRCRHRIEQESMLLEPFGINASTTDLRPELFVGDSARSHAEHAWHREAPAGWAVGDDASPAVRLLVNISTHHVSRLWSKAAFADTIRQVRAAHPRVTVRVIGLNRDRERADWIARESGATHIETPALADALALVATADVVFTPDTAVAHAAAALRKPVIVLMGPGKEEFTPFGTNVHVLAAETEDCASVRAPDAARAVIEEVGASERALATVPAHSA